MKFIEFDGHRINLEAIAYYSFDGSTLRIYFGDSPNLYFEGDHIAALAKRLDAAIAPSKSHPVRVTVLYPMPISASIDAFLEAEAFNHGGKFVGSGADSDRDLVFDFESNAQPFISFAESCGCTVQIAKLEG